MSFDGALERLRERPSPSDPAYREACEVVADNLDSLPYRVFIHLPGGLNGNSDPAWRKVKARSEECCSCGNERVFEPRTMRTTFEPAQADPIVLARGDTLYVRPAGAPASATYVMFEVVGTAGEFALRFITDPMSGAFNFNDLFSAQGFRLGQLSDALAGRNGEPAVFARDMKHVKGVPIVGIGAVDPEAGTVTIILDADVETFDPESEEVHAH